MKNYPRLYHKNVLLLFVIIFTSKAVYSQLLDFCGTLPFHQASSIDPDSIWFDRFGNSYDISDDAESTEGSSREKCGYFEITYTQNISTTFKSRICDVFSDVSDLIEQRVNFSICGDTIYGTPVKIFVSRSSLDTGILGIGSPTVYKSSGIFGCHEIAQNRIYDKINGSRIDNPLDPGFDGRLFITSLPLYTFYTGTDNTPDGQYDLYSVVLHEVGHLLGIFSLIDTIGLDDEISLWDKFIFTTEEYDPNSAPVSSQPLLISDCESNCWTFNNVSFENEVFLDSILELNCDITGDLDFIFDELGIAPIVGGNLEINNFSHLHPLCNGQDIDYVMQNSITNDTILNQRRNFTNAEINILCKLGYKTSSCDGCYVTGIREPGIYHENLYYPIFFDGCKNDTFSIAITDLLCNVFTNGNDLQITSFLTPSGLYISVEDDSIKLYSSLIRDFELDYTIMGCECHMINLTAIISIVDCTQCEIYNACSNLVCIDDFEEFANEIGSYTIHVTASESEYWVYENSNSNTIDICSESNGNTYIRLAGYPINSEGLALKLKEPLEPGCKMIISLDASGAIPGTPLRVHASQYPPCSIYEARNKLPCSPTMCNDYLYNPICIDSVILQNNSSGALTQCQSNANLLPVVFEHINHDSFPLNYVIISTDTISTFLQIDNIEIRKSCLEPCFSYQYGENCSEVSFNACDQDSLVSHSWAFGDDSTSVETNPVHIYNLVDTFIVTHIVEDTCGNRDTSHLSVIVNSQNEECCPDTTITESTVWDQGNVPYDGRFHTITVSRGVAFEINDDVTLTFCEGGALIIEPGAYVDLEGDLTAYGQMTWKGVFVVGDSLLNQANDLDSGGFNGLQQGFLQTRTGASIKNAEIAVRNYGKTGSSSSGGMIRCEETLFQNNTVGTDFIEYQNFNDSINQPLPSLGSFIGCRFYTDTEYYLHDPFYAFARISKVDGVAFKACKFVNSLLPELPSQVKDFGFGIMATDADFKVRPIISTGGIGLCPPPCTLADSTLFRGLGHGIYVMTELQSRPYSVYHAAFENCLRGITDISRGGATILYTTFSLGEVPDQDFSYGQIGAEFHYPHDGFTLQENLFIVQDDETEVIPIGIVCNGLGEFDNEIRRNTFIGIETANQAFGVNADLTLDVERGLAYFCNFFDETPSQGYDFHIPDTPEDDYIHPYQTAGSSQGSNVSTGNHFAYSGQDFMNYGEGGINYWYYPPGDNEEPRDSFSLGISDFQGDSNTCQVAYCAPPCIEDVEDIKEDFITHVDNYNVSLDNYLDALLSENQLKIDTARSKALYYRRLSSRDTYTVLQHLMIDTLEYNTDSLITWMGYLDTYGAEVMIAGENAAAGDFESALDVLETVAVRRDLSTAQSVDLEYLLDIYYLLEEKPLLSFSPSDRSYLRNIAYLNTGAASGVSRALLSSFGEYIPLPYYHGEHINFRSSSQDSSQTVFSGINQNSLKIYPNPTSGDIIIEWEDQEFNCVS